MITNALSTQSLKSVLSDINLWSDKRRFKRKHQLAFLNNMTLLTKSGMSLDIALQSLAELSAARKVERKVARDLAQAVIKGEPVHYAMEKWFDADIAAAFSTGDHHSGATANITASLIERSNWLKSAIDKTLRSNAYLFLTMLVGIAGIIFVGLNVLPKISSNFVAEDVPFVAKAVMGLANFLTDYGLFLLMIGITAGVVLTRIYKTSTSTLRMKTLDSVFPFSIYKQVSVFNNVSQLIKMIEWGDTPLQAAQKIKGYSSPYIAHFMGLVSSKASSGEQDIHDILDVGLLSSAGAMQTQLASKAETGVVASEIINSVPMVLRVETESALNRLKVLLNATLTVLIISTLMTLFFSILSVYGQLISTTNVGY